jgi:hypothetical protein
MFLFLRLVLAHFLADFPLQPDTIYRLKTKNLWGQTLHATIFVACSIALGWPFLKTGAIWILFLFLGASHFVIDCLKVRYVDKGGDKLWSFLVDQFLHLALIGVIFLTDLKNLSLSPKPSFFLGRLYANDLLILSFIILIILTSVISRIRTLSRPQSQ